MEDSADYTPDFDGGFHPSASVFAVTKRPSPIPEDFYNRIREHENSFYQNVFNVSLVLVFLLQILLVWLFFVRRRQQREDNAELEAAVHFQAGGVFDPVLGVVVPAGNLTAPAPPG